MRKNLNTLHEKILFMISLPQTAEFEAYKANVSECINKLREKGVDVCESIHHEDLATISQYNIVIIVAHHDTDDDALLLADGKLSMDDFVNSIPEDFSGELDFSSCYSASVMKAIKNRCPNCHIQASIHQTTLALRLLAYPFVIDIVNEDNSIEYHDAYMKVLDMMLEAASESSESEEEQPDLVKLGNQLSSVYAPSEVKRASRFMIQIILHYDSESGTILAIAKGHEPDTIWRGKLLDNLCEGDIFSVKIRFDSENIYVVDDENAKHNEYVKQITVNDEVVEEQIMAEVASEFIGSSFWTIIDLLKENNWVPSFKFKIIVSDNESKIPAEVVVEIPNKGEEGREDEVMKDKEIVVQLVRKEIFKNEEEARLYIQFCRSANSSQDVAQHTKMLVNKGIIRKDKCKRPLWTILRDAKLYIRKEANWDKMMP